MGELIIPIFMIILGTIFYTSSLDLPIKEGYPMTSATYPKFLAACMIIGAVVIIIRAIKQWKSGQEGEALEAFDSRILIALGALVLFYAGLKYVGYMVSSIAMLVIISLLLQKGKPRLLDTIVLPVGLSVGLYYIFWFMGIYLPTGSLFRRLF